MEDNTAQILVDLMRLASNFFNQAADLLQSRVSFHPIETPTLDKQEKRKKCKLQYNKSCYQLFMLERSKTLKQNPENAPLKLSEISKLISQEWKTMPDEEKKIWKDKADLLRGIVKNPKHNDENPKLSLLKLLEDEDDIFDVSQNHNVAIKNESPSQTDENTESDEEEPKKHMKLESC
ncbi:unnamed protein product [Blepharisma stoltei]|uniref:HMG box domain-containing protein n=1 Tax=Blepharisma stoltei TaxID=1481888 RepID=A0AAU9K865_9CILI|nr:unnamed protein product [Blepharisma stoltei]